MTGKSGHTRFAHWHEAGLFMLLVLLLVFAGRIDPAFLVLDTQISLSTHIWELAILALPMSMIILTGGIDLSVGSTMALSAVVLGLTFEAGIPVWFSALLAMAAGALAGALNGLFVTAVGVHPLIVTLATLAAYRGVAEGISFARPVSGFPEEFTFVGRGYVAGLPLPALIFAVALTITAWVLLLTHFGRNIYAVGHNEKAARFSGIATGRIKMILYTASGLCSGIAAVLYVARRNTAKADIGTGLELEVITAVVLGGTSIYGGRGTILGTALGICLIHEVREFVAWHWSRNELVLVVIGCLLILSVQIHKFMTRKTQNP